MSLKNNSQILNNNLIETQERDQSVVNISKVEAYSICQRCKMKESVFSCIVCESFKFLCTKCDNYVHSLPSKQLHHRLAIISDKCKKNEKQENIYKEDSKFIKVDDVKINDRNLYNLQPNNSFDLNYKFNLSPINRLNTINKDKELSTVDYNTLLNQKNTKHNNHNTVNYSNNPTFNGNVNESTNIDYLNLNKNNMNIQEYSHGVNSNTFKIPNAQAFSREFVLEIKTIFDREKSELLYKNNSLQMTIERLKVNFNEQINFLNNQLEDINKRSALTINQIQENCDNKIKQISDERDGQYEEFKNKLHQLENINEELSKKLEENLKNICEIKTTTGYQQSKLDMEIRQKDEEITKTKNYYEEKLVELRKYFEDDKIKIMESYDKNINLLISEFDKTKDKLNKLLKERENDLRNIIENHKFEIEKFQNYNKDLNEEIQCHKMNIVSIRNKAEDEKNELEFLREENDSMKRELRFHISELKKLDGHNKALLKENDDLKIQISKLDKLLYGKIRISMK